MDLWAGERKVKIWHHGDEFQGGESARVRSVWWKRAPGRQAPGKRVARGRRAPGLIEWGFGHPCGNASLV